MLEEREQEILYDNNILAQERIQQNSDKHRSKK